MKVGDVLLIHFINDKRASMCVLIKKLDRHSDCIMVECIDDESVAELSYRSFTNGKTHTNQVLKPEEIVLARVLYGRL